MGRYPRGARNARVKCLQCNAPATETTDDTYVCVECGKQIFNDRSATSRASGDD